MEYEFLSKRDQSEHMTQWSLNRHDCDTRSTILGHRAPLIHTWAPRPCFLHFPKFRSLSLSSVLITILALCPLVSPPLCIFYSSPFFQVSDVHPEPFFQVSDVHPEPFCQVSDVYPEQFEYIYHIWCQKWDCSFAVDRGPQQKKKSSTVDRGLLSQLTD